MKFITHTYVDPRSVQRTVMLWETGHPRLSVVEREQLRRVRDKKSVECALRVFSC